ncbi:acetyl-CoA carboxylase carboxyltransferase subunit alpha [Cyanobacterium aponinum UTEX 3222]|uniref:Acetyl-coenzyme A carboxylase carboxyl transferase subunit alpha n=3 Tax=Cyanobacterium aponinum TaxID=379064 RepID=K9Z068_CYAAP|nr:acetyl-CoA carboxylase carboxyltransferase subunit alpha [Cyanobacterium aponinum]WRL40524.1 acetyl-CoA carboxylase carboxyltransferase subunit alpha [Cyanobacterium aponinum UTEX 3222]AFZ52596.1 acetyl-CoA carboxylase carboxyltransferase subunit alpha [Cyanobacterium aponinum PCC 10605]MBD2393230.1 acetyl-CoA carboxylase carboxyltransferase subunit alpha [Cyanobacterium aponinum FACHB-4101]MTF37407.1 acetyl-CoA carboxylase carboxyltransferase subunit alpha [Cyanobacterium aponinum 0216]PHV
MAKTAQKRTFLLEFEKPLVELQARIDQIRELGEEKQLDVSGQLQELEGKVEQLRQEIFSTLTPAQKLQIARHPRRPSTLDYVQAMCDEWLELHGDRRGSDDLALIGGIARLEGRAVVIIGHQKGRDTKDNVARNFGMASPGGYRKAMRLMEHANRFSMPIITFIDTPGAYAGVEAEKLGQGEAIARNLREMFSLEVPIISTVIGEGGSGGALGIGVAEKLMMFEHSVYTVASPEACAAILWKDAKKSEQAAQALKITAYDLKDLGIIDQILPEPPGCAHSDPLATAEILKQAILENLEYLSQLPTDKLKELRYQKFRNIGVFIE